MSNLIESFLKLQGMNRDNLFEAAKKMKGCSTCGKMPCECKMEEELKGGQKKIDANHNGKIDADDFKILRSKKGIKEEEQEQIDELSKDTLTSYALKAHKSGDMASRMSNSGAKKGMTDIANKRYQGVQTAIKKIAAKEELEVEEDQIDEGWKYHQFSDASSAKKALDAHRNATDENGMKLGGAARHLGDGKIAYAGTWHGPKPSKTKMAAEEVEEIDEKYMGFKKLEKSIASKGGVRDPAAVAASIGRKKYGKSAFQKAAASGKKMDEEAMDEGYVTISKGGPVYDKFGDKTTNTKTYGSKPKQRTISLKAPTSSGPSKGEMKQRLGESDLFSEEELEYISQVAEAMPVDQGKANQKRFRGANTERGIGSTVPNRDLTD